MQPAELEALRERIVRFCAGYLRRVDLAEDAASECFARLLALERAPENARAWLFRAARNHCSNVLRDRAARGIEEPLESELALAASITGAATRLARFEDRERMRRLLESLSADERELLRLRYADDLSREEIADVVGLETSTVKSRLFEAIEKLRRHAAAAGLTQGER